MPDVYWAAAEDHGILLRFDENQVLDTVFLYVQPIEGGRPVDLSSISDVALFDSSSQVQAYAAEHGIRVKTGSVSKVQLAVAWARLECDDHQVHYVFREGVLTLITISSTDERKVT